MRFIYIFIISLLSSFFIQASGRNASVASDSLKVETIVESDTVMVDTVGIDTVDVDTIASKPKKKKNFFQRFIDYFGDANKKNDKKFDFSIIGGPHYSSDTKLGLGLVGAGLYKMDRNDSTLQPSNVSIYGDVSIVGFYLIGIRGNNIFPKDRFRLNYSTFLFSFPSSFWGIGYDECNVDENATRLKYFQARVKVEFLARLAKNLYLGPLLMFDFAKVDSITHPERLAGMPYTVRNYGFGATMNYDTRDVITNPHKGIYAYVTQVFRPSWLWNTYSFSSTEFGFHAYHRVWKSGLLAYQLTGQFNFGNPAWSMMARMGGSNSMRGYYEGRYRDKHMLTCQIELRQHIWRRVGGVVWIGAGNVFHDKRTFKKILPNYGIGFRWEFKKNVNVRLDYGFGKNGQSSFLFNINEAF